MKPILLNTSVISTRVTHKKIVFNKKKKKNDKKIMKQW